MQCITPNRRTLVKVEVVAVEKRRVPSKHYSYVINVSWSDRSETVIYRRYSKFFEFQIILLETFPWEGGLKEPSARVIPFLPGKVLFRRSNIRDVAMKRLRPIDEYCKALVKLPLRISHCDHVLDFFEPRQEDFNPIREESTRRKDDQVARSQSLRIVRRTRSLEIGEISGPLLLEPYIAVADYKSIQQKELTITIGQRVEVIEKNENGWWFISDEEGERGWVPGVYLENPEGTAEDLVTKRAELGHGEHYVTTHGYTAENADDISFGAGVIVEVLQKNLEGWWLCSYDGRQGFAPASYLEKSHNWVPESRGVEIISSIRDLKLHRHSLPASSLSSISFPSQKILNMANEAAVSKDTNSISKEPRSPVSPTYKKEKTVQPPPKRSSVKRTNKKRPDAPPPRPPPISEEPTYEYTTIAQFNANIPDGVSFDEEMKVKVLEKSPGGWWFIKIDEEEGWAPASHIEKREVVKLKVAPPSRPKPPMLQNNTSTPTSNFSPVRKVPSVPNVISHPILEKVASMPTSFSQSSLLPAKRPLPPLPVTTASHQSQNDSEAYEEVGSSQSRRDIAATSKAPLVTSVSGKKPMRPISEKPSESETPGPADFRSVLKSSIVAKHTEMKNKPTGLAAWGTNVSKSLPEDKSIPQNNTAKSIPGSKPTPPKLPGAKKPNIGPKVLNPLEPGAKPTPPKLPGAKKPNAGPKVSNPLERPANFRKTSASKSNGSSIVTPFGPKKQTHNPKIADSVPKPPPKPKSAVTSSKAKPVSRNVQSSDDGAITDFRSVLRTTQRKQSGGSNRVERSHSLNAEKVLSTETKVQQNKPPSLPKKPGNLPLKPTVFNKMKGFDVQPDGAESNTKPSATRKPGAKPLWNGNSKPVLRRFQTNNNNSNTHVPDKKPVFTVGHARIELKHKPDFSETLTKRGSPDGQVDVKFEDGAKECKTVPVTPPERKKKATKKTFEKGAEKLVVARSLKAKTDFSRFCVAVSSYIGLEESEISFEYGDKVEVLDKAENDWWYVKIGENIGWAPSSFFRLTNASDSQEKEVYNSANAARLTEDYYDDVYTEIPDQRSRTLPATFVAVADFVAEQSSALSLRVGDEVTVTQEADGGWWYAISSNGSEGGWVPSSYLDPV